jgi:hypothetical protein
MLWTSGDAVAWGTTPQDGRSRARFPIGSVEIILSAFGSPGALSAVGA